MNSRDPLAADGDAPDIVVLGGANTDYLIRAHHLPGEGQTVEGDLFLESPGGKGVNQSVAASRLGGRVAYIGRLGSDDRGDRIIARLGVENVMTRYVARDAAWPTGAALIMVGADGRKQTMANPGSNRRVSGLDIQTAGRMVKGARVVVCSLEVPFDAVERVLRLAARAGVRTVLDPAPPYGLDEEILSTADIVKPNRFEAEALSGAAVTDRASAEEAGRILLDRGAGAVLVGAPRGTALVTQTGSRWLAHWDVDSVDETGAGDTQAAALAVGLAEDWDLEKAASFAVGAAALATTGMGAQAAMPSREAVQSLLSRGTVA